jgi:hypothetical protein
MKTELLLKLADYLEKLPLDQWDYTTYGNGSVTVVGCASAHCVTLWPETWFFDFGGPRTEEHMDAEEAAADFFDVDFKIIRNIFLYLSYGPMTTAAVVASKLRETIDGTLTKEANKEGI